MESLKRVEGNQNKNTIEVFDENIIIQEGKKKLEETAGAGYEWSSRLRKYTIECFTKENRINCHCCSFNFSDFYGKELGWGFIEIHHKKPIFKYKDDDIENTLARAVLNLIPACSNCHRMIHRN
jgi:5-methylcytosine-specific restriction protein A